MNESLKIKHKIILEPTAYTGFCQWDIIQTTISFCHQGDVYTSSQSLIIMFSYLLAKQLWQVVNLIGWLIKYSV